MALMPMMGAGPGPADPASPPSGNPGMAADAMSKVREAIRLLEMALPNLPTGSDPHKDVLDSIGKLSKSVPATEAIPGVQQSQLLGLQQEAAKQAPLQALMRSMGQGPNVPPVSGM
jgi:hypothetical protein